MWGAASPGTGETRHWLGGEGEGGLQAGGQEVEPNPPTERGVKRLRKGPVGQFQQCGPVVWARGLGPRSPQQPPAWPSGVKQPRDTQTLGSGCATRRLPLRRQKRVTSISLSSNVGVAGDRSHLTDHGPRTEGAETRPAPPCAAGDEGPAVWSESPPPRRAGLPFPGTVGEAGVPPRQYGDRAVESAVSTAGVTRSHTGVGPGLQSTARGPKAATVLPKVARLAHSRVHLLTNGLWLLSCSRAGVTAVTETLGPFMEHVCQPPTSWVGSPALWLPLPAGPQSPPCKTKVTRTPARRGYEQRALRPLLWVCLSGARAHVSHPGDDPVSPLPSSVGGDPRIRWDVIPVRLLQD